jgi:hypothetical protein
MFDIYLTENRSDSTLKNVINFLDEDAADFFNCSQIHWIQDKTDINLPFAVSSNFKFKGEYQGKTLEFPIRIAKSTNHKCIRCFKYLAEQENSICPFCMTFLPKDFDLANALKSM